jgi:hypothetical protein
MNKDDLLKSCEDLDLLLQKSIYRDFDGVDLYDEILLFQEFLKANDSWAVYTRVKTFNCEYLNMCSRIGITLTVVTVHIYLSKLPRQLTPTGL